MPQDLNFSGIADAKADEAAASATPLSAPDFSGVSDVAPERPSDSGALALHASARIVPFVERVFEELATNPGVKSGMSTVGQLAGGAQGLMSGNPLAVAGGVWAGGKAGWHTGKLMQRLAAPVATAAENLAPYAQAVSTLSGAQGALDLAQMADPERKDIGVLGVSLGKAFDKNNPADRALARKRLNAMGKPTDDKSVDALIDGANAQPAWLNEMAGKIRDVIHEYLGSK